MSDKYDNWCRHYNGIALNASCKAGVKYEDVRDNSVHPPLWPCINPECSTTCVSFEHYTLEEKRESQQKIADFLNKMNEFSERKTDACFLCGKTVTKVEKIGRCAYARPCGCRLWQGSVPEAWK